MSRLARRVVVAHPGQVRLIFRAKRKNDRIDARKPAKLLYLDEVPAAHYLLRCMHAMLGQNQPWHEAA